jgi:hypothetical protein
MDIATLARDVSIFLAPFLPYLVKGGEEAAKEAGKKFGGAVWEPARALWGKLQPKVEAKPAAQEAVQYASAEPDKDQARTVLAWQLEMLLKENPALAADVAKILDEAKATGINVSASGERNIAVGGNVSSSTFITGNQNRVNPGSR